MATTRSRPPRGREQARHATGGAIVEHSGKIYGVAIGGAVIIVAVLAVTSVGHVIDAAVQHFMLYYAGVFTLIALCASVAMGFLATDRMVLGPGHRVFIQSAHRAVSFGALAFLIVHIITEILAQRSHVLDAVIPFLSPFRTFYIGLGTISSDLIILLVITGIYRKRFTTNGNAWRWRAIHYSSYAAFVFGVWHGLLAGRAGKPYVDWSYGFVVAMVGMGVAVRILSNSLRPKESLSSPPVSEAASSGSAPMRAASMFAQLGIVRSASFGVSAVMPGGGAGTRTALPATGGQTGPMRAIAALPAPVMPDAMPSGRTGQQPVYEPGYDGPPRYAGAPRDAGTGPMPTAATGPMPRVGSGPLPRVGTGPLPRAGTGPLPRPGTGPLPRAGTGPLPRPGTGPLPRPGTGPLPRAGTGPLPRAGTGSFPATGPRPAVRGPAGSPDLAGPSGPRSGPVSRPQTGPMPRSATGPLPRPQTGPLPRPQTGPLPRAATGPYPAVGGTGPRPGAGPARPAHGGPAYGGPAYAGPAPTGPSPTIPSPTGRGGAIPPWENGMPTGDPGLRYREPGPGMPGYRPAEPRGELPYGGDPYLADPYAVGRDATDPYGVPPYDAGQYPAGQYSSDPYATDPYAGGTHYPAGQYPADQYWDGHQ